MDIDRPHFRTTSTGSTTAAAANSSELFICFTSRFSSSSSMKLSKSILSPGRAARDGGGPASLSSSISRRLRTNGSLKGGQASPFFPTTGKKRGCGFENPEPSSPKVTCIGQVRVKTKKKKAKPNRSLSKRRGEVSFRKIEQSCGDDGQVQGLGPQQQQRCSNASAQYQGPPPQECLQPQHRNQRWVHLPISICEALRTFGAEFSCLFPCRSSCFSASERETSEKQSDNGCGAVFARWLVSVNDGDGGKRREIELVVGGGDEEEMEESRVSMRASRRHVFEDIEVKDDRIELKGERLEREKVEAARASICIPPKNALLLMRCRSDPMKMAALTNRFSWDATKNDSEELQVEENVVGGEDEVFEEGEETAEKKEMVNEVEETLEIEEDGEEIKEEELEICEEMVEEKAEEVEMVVEEALVVEAEAEAEAEAEEEEEEGEEEEEESNMSSFEALLDQENTEQYEECCPIQDEEQVEEQDSSPICHLSPSIESDEEVQSNEAPPLLLQEPAAAAMDEEAEEESSTILNESVLLNNEGNQAAAGITADLNEDEEQPATAAGKADENQQNKELVMSEKKEKEKPLLPECLLLMMCEPKLSMEVSRETWVCSTDVTRWLPERRRRTAKAVKPGCDHEPGKRRLSVDSKAKPIIDRSELHQPPRSSCSLPAAAASLAAVIEQKLVNAVAYEPFVLTRCKSEPMRTAASKLAPESCFWKNAVRKLEPHAMGVGAAEIS